MIALGKSLTTHRIIKANAVLHGQRYETVAVEHFEKEWNVVTQPCGLFVSLVHPQLAATPDRVIDEDCIVEVKYPYTARDKIITPVIVPFLKGQGNSLVLDDKHNYYYQIQGQLFCSNRVRCLLVVYTFKGIVVVKVTRDDMFIQEMVKKLLKFYESHFRSAVLNKFFYRNYDLYAFNPK